MVKISDIISDFLIANKIEIVFGVIGSANSYIYNSINERTNIKLIAVHHEQVAIMAMGAYYRSTGKLAASLVTAGGGSSNAFTGILSNWADSIPGIIISGQEQSYYIQEYSDMRMYGIQGYDSVKTYQDSTKMSIRITKDNVYEVFHNAFEISQEGRPGPIFLEVPFDVQNQSIEEKIIIPYRKKELSLLECKNETEIILNELKYSKRPVILAGHGIKLSKSDHLFKKFIETYKIPTILSWSAVDLLSDDHKLNFGRSGVQGQRSSNFIIQNCDLLIVLGSRLSLLQTGYSREDFAPNAKIIHIDIDPTETRKFNYCNINKDINLILQSINRENKINTLDISEWILYCNKIKEKYNTLMPQHLLDPKNSYSFIDILSKKIPNNYTIVTDMGTALLSGFYGYKIKENQKMFTSLGLGEMGYGIAAAVGAGFGDKPVLCLNCDGGMMMNLQELQTIKTYNLPVKIVIFNNDGYLMIKHTQNMLFSGNKVCVDKSTGVELPDYEKVANAFGYNYYTQDQIDLFLEDKDQSIIEVFMDPNQEFIPKVKGLKMEDGSIKSGLLEEMSPMLPLNEVKEVMISGLNKRSNTILR